ncbi:MAG: response regulator transcription factor [Proteobacteria bacterium]|jgi:DNA-binding NarL/FixJ family response regulator|nr:response regulator transcription factor [Desulfocapsa sp.]MBU3944186.1 response regulator transcription factor [Pseudomonadota bacterium]MCG2743595.1 response regulator transcription factor [Desulfobacteraceae bacterium]MDO8946412.1 response regulator transcription factor [Desulfocapsaceae bacterium]MBU3984790.1 response regulator transcription factor [Pseudomonadota bacterium]
MILKIIVVDDHKIVRDGLCSLIEGLSGYTIVGRAENGRQAIEVARREKPDIIIMDVSMPEMNGIDATSSIMEEIPSCKIIVLSMHSDKRFITGALQAGASGFLLKECAFQELNQALDAVRSGQTYLSPKIAGMVVHDYRRRLLSEAKEENLTTKEREVLQLIAEGRSTKEIAERLFVSVKAIEGRRGRLMEKLQINSVAGLVKYAIREGLTEL